MSYAKSIQPRKANLTLPRMRPQIEFLTMINPVQFPSTFMRNHHRGCEGRARKRALFEVAKSGVTHPRAYLIEAEVAPMSRQQQVQREHRSRRRLRKLAIHDVIFDDHHPAFRKRLETLLYQRGVGFLVLAMNDVGHENRVGALRQLVV